MAAAGYAPAAAAAPAAGIGLGALAMPLLLAFGPAVFSRLFSIQDDKARLRQELFQLLTPENMKRLTEQFYKQNIQSPAFSQGQQVIASGANATANQVAQNLGARGIGTSGTGAILSSLTPSLVGQQMAGLRTTAHNAAAADARQTIQQQADALINTSGPSMNRQLFSAGLDSFTPYLASYLRAKYPTFMPPAPKVAA